jgi:N-acetylglucosamine-6-phosphate deacetylase
MLIKNAQIVTENKIFKGFIEFNHNKILAIKQGKTNKDGYDAKGLFLLPAFIDSHTHGGYGYDFNMLFDAKKNKTQLANYFKHINHEGVGSILMTTISCSKNDLHQIANNYQQMKMLDKTNVVKG